MSDSPPAPADPRLDASIDAALDPYRALLPTPVLGWMAEVLRDELPRHPVSARLLRQLAPAPVVARSADVVAGAGEREQSRDLPLERARQRGRR